MEYNNTEIKETFRIRICYWGYAEGEPTTYVKEHAHGYYQANFSLSGSCRFQTSNGDFDIKENDIIILSPGVRHDISYPESHLSYSCKFYADIPDIPPVLHLPASDFTKGIIQAAKTILETTFPPRFFGNPLGAVIMPNDHYQTVMEYFIAGVLDVCRREQDYPALPYAIRDYLNRQPRALFSVADAAEACHYSRNHFSLIIRKATGMSAKEFLRKRRFEYAKRLLSHSSKSVGEIAKDLGYSNQFHFSSFFKLMQGISPREYRTAIQSGEITESGEIV